jgi:hypothetical protein
VVLPDFDHIAEAGGLTYFAQGVVDGAVGKGGDEHFFAVASEGGGQVSEDPGLAGSGRALDEVVAIGCIGAGEGGGLAGVEAQAPGVGEAASLCGGVYGREDLTAEQAGAKTRGDDELFAAVRFEGAGDPARGRISPAEAEHIGLAELGNVLAAGQEGLAGAKAHHAHICDGFAFGDAGGNGLGPHLADLLGLGIVLKMDEMLEGGYVAGGKGHLHSLGKGME